MPSPAIMSAPCPLSSSSYTCDGSDSTGGVTRALQGTCKILLIIITKPMFYSIYSIYNFITNLIHNVYFNQQHSLDISINNRTVPLLHLSIYDHLVHCSIDITCPTTHLCVTCIQLHSLIVSYVIQRFRQTLFILNS